jgi:hypothetical protein
LFSETVFTTKKAAVASAPAQAASKGSAVEPNAEEEDEAAEYCSDWPKPEAEEAEGWFRATSAANAAPTPTQAPARGRNR